MEDEVNDADIISTVEFNEDGELLATGDKGGRIVIFQREQPSKATLAAASSYAQQQSLRTEYNVYSTFQSHEAEFDYLKSLEIEEKINKIKWLKRKNVAHFLLSTNDKTVKLWKIRERHKRVNEVGGGGGLNGLGGMVSVRDDLNGYARTVSIPVVKYLDRIEVEAIPKRVFANAHTYHINSISLNSDQETFMSADDLRINLWHIEITNQSFNIVDIKPANMEELTEVITAAEFHPKECNLFVYSSSKGIIRLCDMRQSALCDTQAKIFEEREDPTTKNFFSEIISSISDVKFSHSGRYMCTRDYLNIKIWDLHMENRPIETYSVHDYLRNKLCVLYENDCIFDKFECSWSYNDECILSGSYNNFFKSFNRKSKQELMYECSREQTKPRQVLRPKRVVVNSNLNGPPQAGGVAATGSQSPSLNSKRNNAAAQQQSSILNGAKSATNNNNGFKDEVNVDQLDFAKKILHASWHPKDNIVAIAATNNLYLFYNREVQQLGGTSYSPNSILTQSSSSSSSSTTPTQSSTIIDKASITTNPTCDEMTLQQHQQQTSTTSSVNSINTTQITLNTSFYTVSSSSSSSSSSNASSNVANTSVSSATSSTPISPSPTATAVAVAAAAATTTAQSSSMSI